MARRRTWWGNPALRQAIALTEGAGAPTGYAFLRDAQGNYLTDTQGNRLLARAA